MRLIIPALRRVAEAAKALPNPSTEMALALTELELAEAETAQRLINAVRDRGRDCTYCGRRFLPLEDERFCSIGCRWAANEND